MILAAGCLREGCSNTSLAWRERCMTQMCHCCGLRDLLTTPREITSEKSKVRWSLPKDIFYAENKNSPLHGLGGPPVCQYRRFLGDDILRGYKQSQRERRQ